MGQRGGCLPGLTRADRSSPARREVGGVLSCP
nr:MAG TPA: hypothetical protein [Caudoviricetes sp.]